MIHINHYQYRILFLGELVQEPMENSLNNNMIETDLNDYFNQIFYGLVNLYDT
jgi:hypothetical protein